MKKLLIAFWALLQFSLIEASNPVVFKISDGLYNATLVKKIEKNLSNLLTEINAAHEANRDIDCASLGLSDDVSFSLQMLWENAHFYSMDEAIVQSCLTSPSGYQIRNLRLMMKATDGDESTKEEYQEAVVNFNKQGEIVSFFLAVSKQVYANMLTAKNDDMIDYRRRQLILDYVEQFRTSYNQKDTVFLNQIFSDDALIVTGTVIKQQKRREGIKLPSKIKYTTYDKKTYLAKLKQAFDRNKHIRVTFDKVDVMRHGSNANIYGVRLQQGWTQDRYHDDGIVFLLWDFTDEEAPQIHVRTWQPLEVDGKALSEDDVFGLSDFKGF